MSAASVIVFSFPTNRISDRQFFQRLRAGLVGAILFLLMMGCGVDSEVDPVTTANAIPTATEIIFPTLPPTWTPTVSPSPTISPTATTTPTTTVSPSPTRTLSADQICDLFRVTGTPQDGIFTSPLEVLGFSWENAPPDSGILITVFPSGENTDGVGGLFAPDMGFNAVFDLALLTEAGDYTWQISILMDAYGEICSEIGSFTHELVTATPTPFPTLSTETATP